MKYILNLLSLTELHDITVIRELCRMNRIFCRISLYPQKLLEIRHEILFVFAYYGYHKNSNKQTIMIY